MSDTIILNQDKIDAYRRHDINTFIPYSKKWKFDDTVWDLSYLFRFGEITENDWKTMGISEWDVSNIQNMDSMFNGRMNFNEDISNWDVSNVRDMKLMFSSASSFNQDIGRWNVSNVENMEGMFLGASSFNKDIGGWDVSNVTDMRYMFYGASSFNKDISGWDVSNVRNNMMHEMFSELNENIKWTIASWYNNKKISFSLATVLFDSHNDFMKYINETKQLQNYKKSVYYSNEEKKNISKNSKNSKNVYTSTFKTGKNDVDDPISKVFNNEDLFREIMSNAVKGGGKRKTLKNNKQKDKNSSKKGSKKVSKKVKRIRKVTRKKK